MLSLVSGSAVWFVAFSTCRVCRTKSGGGSQLLFCSASPIYLVSSVNLGCLSPRPLFYSPMRNMHSKYIQRKICGCFLFQGSLRCLNFEEINFGSAWCFLGPTHPLVRMESVMVGLEKSDRDIQNERDTRPRETMNWFSITVAKCKSRNLKHTTKILGLWI